MRVRSLSDTCRLNDFKVVRLSGETDAFLWQPAAAVFGVHDYRVVLAIGYLCWYLLRFEVVLSEVEVLQASVFRGCSDCLNSVRKSLALSLRYFSSALVSFTSSISWSLCFCASSALA